VGERKVKWEQAPTVTITTADRVEGRRYQYDRANDRLRYKVVEVREVRPKKKGKRRGK